MNKLKLRGKIDLIKATTITTTDATKRGRGDEL